MHNPPFDFILDYLHPKLVFAFLLSYTLCFSQGFRTTDTTFLNENKIQSITYSTNKVRDSTVYYSKTTSEKTATFIYKGNGSEGAWVFYDKEGYKTNSYFVSNNKKTGPAVYYYKSGRVSSEENYENNVREGRAIEYYENGTIKWQGNYSRKKLDGESLLYYNNGKLKWAGMYKEGRMSGVRLCYTEFGTLCDGLFVIRDEHNLLEREGMCIAGKPEGEVKLYNNGKLVKTVMFKNGKPDGLMHRYKNDKIVSTELYKNGKFKKDITGESEGN